MCGIFGMVFNDRERRVDPAAVAAATDLMAHRGPDDSGVWVQGNVGLGHRRLSIIDLSPLGHQPMLNDDGTVALVFNGEIYNFQEIHRELEGLGHRFRGHSDTEVIVRAYEQWGYDCVHRFNGMFAFALWDSRRSTLWVARDRLGVKPLYFHADGEHLVVASEIKPILKALNLAPELNPEVVDAFLSVGYVPAPQTMFRGIFKLSPGHFLIYRDGELTQTRYWDFAQVPTGELTPEQAAQKLEALLSDSVGLRMISDVPVGAFLSGGLDSSVVVALMSGLSPEPINTFTVGYDSQVSEEPYAEQVAAQYRTRHRVLKLQPDEFFSSLEGMVDFCEEPVVEPAAIALYRMSVLARESAIVLLSGEGSDELFGGYYLYHLMDRLERVQRFLPLPLLRGVRSLFRPKALKQEKYLDWLSTPLEERYQGTSSYLTESVKRRLYAPDFFSGRGGYLAETFRGHFERVAHVPDTVNRMLYVDSKTWLVDDLLLKADKMTMAASIELRVPFLDYRLVEFAISLPSALKIRGGSGKQILKDLARKQLPAQIVDRKKMGFPVPVSEWFGGDLFPAVCDRIRNSELLSFLDRGCVDEVLRRQQGGEDHGKLLMSLLVLDLWQERFVRGGGAWEGR